MKRKMHFYKEKKKHVLTTQTKHKRVLDSCRHLQQEWYEITYLPVRSDDMVDLNELRAALRSDTGLVLVMAVNNEIGVIQPIEEIGKICKEFNVPFHTNAAQALGKILIDADKSGTVPTPLVVGMGAASEIAIKEMEYDEKWVTKLKDRLLNGVKAKLDGVVVNGSTERRYAGNLNLSFAYAEGESLLMGLKEVVVSSDMAHTSIRFGIGRFTTEEEIDKAVELTVNQVAKLREMSPLYEMVKEGIDIKTVASALEFWNQTKFALG
ncbi:cysteine desulfurase, mitochondrial [Tanacetum coccineum]